MQAERAGWRLAGLVLAIGVMACDGGGSAGAPERGGPRGGAGADRPVQIIAQTVAYERDEVRIEAVGTARARASAVLYAETGGEVTEILFNTGDFVAAGTPLLRLEDDEERLAVRLAEVSVRQAEQLLARYRRIEDTGAISDSQIDEAQTRLEASRIELEQATVALDERTVRAPFAGYVGLTDIDPGARITPSTEITQIDDRRLLVVDFQAPEQVFARIAPETPVEAAPFAEPDQVYTARVVDVDSRIDPNRRTFRVRAAIDNASDALRPGMSFRIGFRIEGDRYPSIPEAAIMWGSDGSYLWAVREGRAQQVPVTIVARRQGRVLVRGAVPEGSKIVAEGVQKVRQGARVMDLTTRGGPRGGGE